ncbi:MAG: hypothetical protein RL139_855 [Gemmatimonadota bacterium]
MPLSSVLDDSQVPPRLPARVREVIERAPAIETTSAAPPSTTLLEAGASLLQTVLAAPAESPRAVALDLLAADACVTWAFELAAEAGAPVPALADAAMRRLAAEAR